jgi:hypothetical protein
MFPWHANPYLDSDKMATPYPNSLRSAYCSKLHITLGAYGDKGGARYLMPANFELRSIPSRILVRWPLDMAELCLVGCVTIVYVQRQLDYFHPKH